jgi:hypothetical protein
MADEAIAAKLPMCSLCLQPVVLETAKTDEDGQAVHEDCYSAKILQHSQGEFSRVPPSGVSGLPQAKNKIAEKSLRKFNF